MLTTIVAFIIVLGVLVFVHELGHFATAKWAGIKVEEFGFGYPPRLFTFMKRGDTIYTVNLLPLGGFVKMLGEEDPTHPESFARKSAWKRAIVLVAGSAMNVLLAVVLFTAISMIGAPTGDPTGRIQINEVAAGSPAALAGLQPGDYILYVGNQRVRTIGVLQGIVARFYDREVTVTIERDGQEQDVRLVPRSNPPENEGAMGISIFEEREMVRQGPIAALGTGIRETGTAFVAILGGFGELLGRIGAGASSEGPPVAGPLGIAQLTGEVAERGTLVDMLGFMAILSINLAIINLLPIPALDGGRLLFVAVEALRGGRRIDPAKEGLIHLVGMMLLLSLIAFISYFDVVRIISGQPLLR